MTQAKAVLLYRKVNIIETLRYYRSTELDTQVSVTVMSFLVCTQESLKLTSYHLQT